MTRPAFRPVKPRDPEQPKAAVARLYEQNGGAKHVAVKLGLGHAQVYSFTDPQDPAEISFARVAALTSRDAPAAAEYLATLAGGAYLPLPPADSDLGLLTAESIAAHGDAAAELVRALKDGRVTDQERTAAVVELDEAIRALVQLRVAVAGPRKDPDT